MHKLAYALRCYAFQASKHHHNSTHANDEHERYNMKTMIIALAAAICALAAGCKNYEKAASTKTQKNAYVLVVAVENGFAGKCVGSKKDYTAMMSKLKPYAKTQVGLLDKTATRKQVL